MHWSEEAYSGERGSTVSKQSSNTSADPTVLACSDPSTKHAIGVPIYKRRRRSSCLTKAQMNCCQMYDYIYDNQYGCSIDLALKGHSM